MKRKKQGFVSIQTIGVWRKPLEGGGGEQASQDTLYFADRERSCVLVGVLTLLLAPSPPQVAFSTPGRKPHITVVSYRQKSRE